MHYLALASDYDGTLAKESVVNEKTLNALERLQASGCKLLLVTGRFVDNLQQVFPRLDLFSCVVAENGALLYHPFDSTEELLGTPLPKQFIQALQEAGVTPLVTGRVIAATSRANEKLIVDVIEKLGLDLHVILNKGAIMILPKGIDKGTGFIAALRELKLSPGDVVGVGDAENDHSFLALCGLSVAVANALPSLKTAVDYITKADRGDGVTELIELMLTDNLQTSTSSSE